MEGAEKVAILRSYPAMAYNIIDTHVSVNMAEQALQQRQIPFDIIFDEQLDKFENYLVLVLANQESLSKETTARIKEFVKNGGGLVATGNTGIFDEWRRLRKDNGEVVHLFNYNHTQHVTDIILQYKGGIKKALAVSPGEMGTQIIPFTENEGVTELRVPDFSVYMIISLIKR